MGLVDLLQRNVAAAQSIVCEAYVLATEQSIGLDDIDHDVVAWQLREITMIMSNLLACFLDEATGPEDASAIAAHCYHHRPRRLSRVRDHRVYLRVLCDAARRRANLAWKITRRADSGGKVTANLRSSVTRLDVVAAMLNNRFVSEPMRQTIEACRDVVRKDRGEGFAAV